MVPNGLDSIRCQAEATVSEWGGERERACYAFALRAFDRPVSYWAEPRVGGTEASLSLSLSLFIVWVNGPCRQLSFGFGFARSERGSKQNGPLRYLPPCPLLLCPLLSRHSCPVSCPNDSCSASPPQLRLGVRTPTGVHQPILL